MRNKFAKACAGVAAYTALAVVPVAAHASPVMTESGSAVAIGKSISYVNEGTIVFNTSAGPITCTSATLTGTVVTNSGSEIATNIESASFKGMGIEGKCLSEWLGETTVSAGESLPWCLKAGGKLTADTAELRGGKCSEAARSDTTVFISSIATCRYVRASVTTSITTNSDTKVETITSSQSFSLEQPSSILCPSSMTVQETVDPVTAGTTTPLTIS